MKQQEKSNLVMALERRCYDLDHIVYGVGGGGLEVLHNLLTNCNVAWSNVLYHNVQVVIGLFKLVKDMYTTHMC